MDKKLAENKLVNLLPIANFFPINILCYTVKQTVRYLVKMIILIRAYLYPKNWWLELQVTLYFNSVVTLESLCCISTVGDHTAKSIGF